MGLFGGRSYDMYELQKIADSIHSILQNGISVFDDLLKSNINGLLDKNPKFRNRKETSSDNNMLDEKIKKQLDVFINTFPGNDLESEVKNKVMISAYSVWAVGSYLNGQRLISRNNQIRIMEIITGKISTAHEREYYNMCFKTILSHESNKVYQAQRFIEMILDNGEYIDCSISLNGKSSFAAYFVPIVELYVGVLGLKIEKILDSPKSRQSENDITNYLHEVEGNFLTLEKILSF